MPHVMVAWRNKSSKNTSGGRGGGLDADNGPSRRRGLTVVAVEGCVTKREPGELYGSGPPSGTISHPL